MTLLTLAALIAANAAVVAHVALVSNLPKRQKWNWLHRAMMPFAAFDYLLHGGGPPE